MLAQKRIQKDIESLECDLKQLMIDAKNLEEGVPNAESRVASPIGAEQLQKMAKQLEDSMIKFRGQLKNASAKVEDTVEDHPYASIAAALGAGFILGKFISPGRNS